MDAIGCSRARRARCGGVKTVREDSGGDGPGYNTSARFDQAGKGGPVATSAANQFYPGQVAQLGSVGQGAQARKIATMMKAQIRRPPVDRINPTAAPKPARRDS